MIETEKFWGYITELTAVLNEHGVRRFEDLPTTARDALWRRALELGYLEPHDEEAPNG